jgi:hypothetical protein
MLTLQVFRLSLEEIAARRASHGPLHRKGTTMSESVHVPVTTEPDTDSPASPGSSAGPVDLPSGGRPPVRARLASPGQQGGLRAARRIVTAAVLGATGVQVAVWFVICVATGSVEPPWWLWTLLGGALAIGALHLLDTAHPTSRIPTPIETSIESEQQR